MKLIQVEVPGGPEAMRVAERPLPQPGPGEVRIKAVAIGVNAADVMVRKGIYKWMPPLPAVPGNEMAGVIDAAGAGVTVPAVGQRVLVSSRELPFRGGCYAEAICVPATSVYLLPDGISDEDAVTLPNYQFAGALLYESGVRRPSSVAVYGAAGGVGTALVQLAAAEGMNAVAIVSSEAKLQFVRDYGAPHAVRRTDFDTVRDAVMHATGNRGVDVVYAMAGRDFIRNLDLLAPLGTLLSFSPLGGGMGDVDIFEELRARLGKGLGVRCYSIHELDGRREARRALLTRAMDLMAAGRLVPPRATVMPLTAATQAHEIMEAGEVLGKLVLKP